MKFSELVNLIRDYEDATWSPTAMGIKFGCDCGCGGDAYTAESWDEAEQDAAELAKLIVQECVLISRTSTDGFSAGERMEQHFGVK